MVGGSYGTGAASRGAEWWSEVVGCGGDAAELWRSRRKVMTGGPTYQPTTERGEGRARCGVSPRGRRRPGGERESSRLGKEKGSGPRLGWKLELGPIQVIKFFEFLFGIRIFGKFGNLYKEI
jgi:hypothetical protein